MDERQARAAGLGRCAWGTQRGNAENLLGTLAELGAITEDDLGRCLDYLPAITPDPHRWCIYSVDMLAKPRDILATLNELVPEYHKWAEERAPAPPTKPTGRSPKINPNLRPYARNLALDVRERIAKAWTGIFSENKASNRGRAILAALDGLCGPFGEIDRKALERVAGGVARDVATFRMEKPESCADEISRQLFGYTNRRSVRDLISYRKKLTRK